MCGAPSAVLLSHLPFSPSPWKVWLLLAIPLICLKSPPPSCETWQPKHPSHHSSLLLCCLGDESFFSFRQTSASPFLRAELRPCVAAFRSSVCCVFWFIYTLLIVAPHACQESQSLNLAMCIMRAESNSYLKYTWMHEYIYRREAPVHPGESHFL